MYHFCSFNIYYKYKEYIDFLDVTTSERNIARHLYLRRDEDMTSQNIFSSSLYDGRGREIPLLLFGERALIL